MQAAERILNLIATYYQEQRAESVIREDEP